SESRPSDGEQTGLDLNQGTGHEQLPQEEESYIKLVVEVHPNLVVSVETEEDDGNFGSEATQRLDKDTKDLQDYDYEYRAPQTEDKLQQGETSNEEETSVGEDAVDVSSVNDKTLDDINEEKGSQDVKLEQDGTARQTPDKILQEEDLEIRIRNNEVHMDLNGVNAEKVLENTEVALHDACEENPLDDKDEDKAEIPEEPATQENGVSDEDIAVQEEPMNENEVHVGQVNKLNAKRLQPGSAILILEGNEEAMSTQTMTVSNHNADNTDVNTLVLQALEIDSMQCHEMDSHTIITSHQPDTNFQS
ncbi:hypothetical protein M9458_025034, partial [Cirrhinus mrigala]